MKFEFNFVVLVVSLILSIVSARADENSKSEMSTWVNQVATYSWTEARADSAQLSDSELIGLQNKVGLSRAGKCGALVALIKAIAVPGSIIASPIAEASIPVGFVVGLIDGNIKDGNFYFETSMAKEEAVDFLPWNLYKASTDNLSNDFNCENLKILHQMIMDEINKRQENQQ